MLNKHYEELAKNGSWYGKSMYGGWYCDRFDGSKQYHAKTLKELKKLAENDGTILVQRFDNI